MSNTQDANTIRRIADRMAMLWQGRIIWAGPACQIDKSENPFVD